jgi:teichuronic acid biosynthesis glycosyltransferase TuaG
MRGKDYNIEGSPLVSIVMPAHNVCAFLAESIRSIQSQTYPHWELLIIDDASGDNTFEIARRFQKMDSRIKPVQLPTNQGAGFARNIGIKASEGEFIAFLDADDIWLPFKLEKQLDFMQKHKIMVTYSSYELIDEQSESLGLVVRALKELSPGKILKANYVGNLTGIYHSHKLGKLYCPPIRKRQDWALWIQAIQKAGGAKGMEEVLAQYRVRKNSLSGNKWEMLGYNFTVYRKVLGYSGFRSSVLFLQFLFEQFFVKSRQTEVVSVQPSENESLPEKK